MLLLLFILNISAYYLICIIKVRFFSRYFKDNAALNPFVILYIATLPVDICRVIIGPLFLLDDSIYDPYYNYAIFIATLGLIADYFLMIVTIKVTSKYTFVNEFLKFKIKKNSMLLAAAGLYLLFFLCFFLVANESFGFFNWIGNPRVGYQSHRSGAGQFWIFAISFLSVALTLCCIYVEKYTHLFLAFLFFIFSAYFLGSKGILLEFFLFFFILLWLRKFQYIKKIFFIGFPLVLFLMLLNFATSGGGNLSALEIKDIFSYFDHYANSATYFRAYFKDEIPLLKGEVFLTDFWGLVPRAVYPEKPYVYGITIVNEFFWPGAAENTNTPAFGGPVPYFADFGIPGVVLFSFFNPMKFISYFFLGQLLKQYNIESIRHNVLVLCLFIVFTSPYFLYGLPFPLNMLFYLVIIGIIISFNRIIIKR